MNMHFDACSTVAAIAALLVNTSTAAPLASPVLESRSAKSIGVLPAIPGSVVSSGTSKPYAVTFTNYGAASIDVVCWAGVNNPGSPFVNAQNPQVVQTLTAGASATYSFVNNAQGACAPVYSNTILTNGRIVNTWWEFVFNMYGVMDVSREVNMGGNQITATSTGGCIASNTQCDFQCKNGLNSCSAAGTYFLNNCSGPNGCPIGQGGSASIAVKFT